MLCGWAAGSGKGGFWPLRTWHPCVLSNSALPFGPGVTQVPQLRGGPSSPLGRPGVTRRSGAPGGTGRERARARARARARESERGGERERGREGARERGRGGEGEREGKPGARRSAAEILGGDPGLTATKGELPCAP